MRRKNLQVLSIAATVALFMVGCGSNDESTAPDPEEPSAASFITAAVGTVANLNHTEKYVAGQEGFYAANGLDAKIQIFDGGSDVTKAMQAGTVLYGSASTTAVPTARAAGVPLRLIVGGMNNAASAVYDGPLAVVGRSDRGITDQAESLRGKKIGVRTGSTPEQYLQQFLAQDGMTLDDVTIVNMPNADQPASLEKGDVDAVASEEPTNSMNIEALGDNAVIVSRGAGLVGYIVGLGTLDTEIADNRDSVLRFVAATAQANHFIRQNPEKATQDAGNYLTGVDLQIAQDAIENHMSWDPRISECTKKAMEAAVDALLEAGAITEAVPVDDMVDSSFIEQVEKDHPEWFADLPPVPASC